MMSPNVLIFITPLCPLHLSVSNRSQGEFSSQKTAARSQFNEGVVCALEHIYDRGNDAGISFPPRRGLPEPHLKMNGRNISSLKA
jgi:hypothetical protein